MPEWEPWVSREQQSLTDRDGARLLIETQAIPQRWRPAGANQTLCNLFAEVDLDALTGRARAMGLVSATYAGTYFGLVQAFALDGLRQGINLHVLKVAAATHPDVPGFKKHQTPGQIISMLTDAVDGKGGRASTAIREVLGQSHIDPVRLRVVLTRLSSLNTEYRSPAAHKEVLGPRHWYGAYTQIITGQRLLVELVDLLTG